MATITRTKVSRRLQNSMIPCTPISGVDTKESAVHRGQVGQPRPEPVSRTSPPVPTTSVCTTSVVHTRNLVVRVIPSGSRSRSRLVTMRV